MGAVDSAQVVEIGDIVWLNTDDIRPASQFTWAGSLSQTQDNFAEYFTGVAMDQSRSGDTAEIHIKTEGVFEFNCPSGTWEIGDLIGVDDNAGGTALEDQKVINVGDAARAIGYCARRETTATTKVRVQIVSGTMTGGVQSPKASA